MFHIIRNMLTNILEVRGTAIKRKIRKIHKRSCVNLAIKTHQPSSSKIS